MSNPQRPVSRPGEQPDAELARLFDLAPAMLCVLGPDGAIRRANTALAAALGVPAAELPGRVLGELAHPDDRARHEAAMARARAGEADVELTARYGSGGAGAASLTWRLTPADDGGVVYAAGAGAPVRTALDEQLRFRSFLLDQVGQAVIATDMTGVIEYWNAAATDLYGWSAEEAIGRNVMEMMPADDMDDYAAEIMAALARGESWSGEFLVRRKDGTEFCAAVTNTPLRDADGGLCGIVGVSSDVSTRQRADAELRASERKYRLLLEQASDGILVWNAAGRLMVVNDRACEMLGYSLADLSEQPVSALLREGESLAWNQATDGGAVIAERDLLRRDGTLLCVELSVRPLGNGGAQAILRDITARHRVEAAARDADRRVRAQFKAIPVPTYAWQRVESERGVDFVLVDYNDAAVAITRGGIADILGITASAMFDPDSQVAADLHHCLDHNTVVHRAMDYTMRTTGERKALSVTYAPVPPDLVLAHSEDVTDRAQLEEQLRQAQKMEAVGQLAGGVAHDFNNLLTVIQTYAEFLAEEIEDTSVLRGDVLEIQKAASRAASLTRQLLAFSRKQVLQPRVLDLDDVVAGVEPMLRRIIGADIEIVLQASEIAGATRADPGQLEQVLMNLVVNARDAMPSGGTLTIATSCVDLKPGDAPEQAIVPGPYVLLTVHDTGRGIDAATRQRMFEPFFTTKEPGKGTGLGLSTVYGIVKQSEGYIWADSAPGVGTTFSIALPRVEERGHPTLASHAASETSRSTEVVLLVEDEEAVRASSRRILERQGYTVIEARNGRDALQAASAWGRRLDLLVTDMVMPEMGGSQLFARLRAERPTLRVLYMSGYTDDDILRRGLLEAGAAFLQKPFSAHDLATTARGVLDADPAAAHGAPPS